MELSSAISLAKSSAHGPSRDNNAFARATSVIMGAVLTGDLVPRAPLPPNRGCVILDLPKSPPSVNAIWRVDSRGGGHTHVNPKYEAWVRSARAYLNAQGPSFTKIGGLFRATLELKRLRSNQDLDNKIKVPIDFAQKCGAIANDKHMMEITARWSDDTETGCRLTLKGI